MQLIVCEADQKRILAAEENHAWFPDQRSCFCCWLSISGAGRVWSWSHCACARSRHASFPQPSSQTRPRHPDVPQVRGLPQRAGHFTPAQLPLRRVRLLRWQRLPVRRGGPATRPAPGGVHAGWREPSFCGECPPRPLPLQASQRDLLGCPLLWARSEHCLCFTALGKEPRASPTLPPFPFPGRTGQWGLGSLPG